MISSLINLVIFINDLWPDWNVKGKLGPLVQPLSTVATVTTVVSPQWRSVREQPVPFEEQEWLFWSTPEDTAVATYWSACPEAFQVTWPTFPAHCRDTCTLDGGQGPGGQRKGKTVLLIKYSQNIPTKFQLFRLYITRIVQKWVTVKALAVIREGGDDDGVRLPTMHAG